MDSETVQVLLQDAYMFMNPNLSLKLLADEFITFEDDVVVFFHMSLKSSWCSWWSLEHSTNAAKNGSFLMPSLVVLLFLGENSLRNLCIFLVEFGGFLDGGGNGSSWLKEELFFLELCCFGIPGMCSQENGTPFWSYKESDSKEEWEGVVEERVKIGVENVVALWPYLGVVLVVGEVVAIEILDEESKRMKKEESSVFSFLLYNMLSLLCLYFPLL